MSAAATHLPRALFSRHEIHFHDSLTHNVLERVLGHGIRLGGRAILEIRHYFKYYRNYEPEFQRRVVSLRSSLQPTGGPSFNSGGKNVARSVLTPEVY